MGDATGHDGIDEKVADAARRYADRLRDEVKAPAEADRLRDELVADERARELQVLRYAVHGVREKQAMLTPTVRDRVQQEAARLALEVKRPDLLVAAARYRAEHAERQRRRKVDVLVASAERWPHGRNNTGVADRLRRMAVAGSQLAADALEIPSHQAGAATQRGDHCGRWRRLVSGHGGSTSAGRTSRVPRGRVDLHADQVEVPG